MPVFLGDPPDLPDGGLAGGDWAADAAAGWVVGHGVLVASGALGGRTRYT